MYLFYRWGARSCFHKKRYVCQTPTNKYISLKKQFKENFDPKKCKHTDLDADERELCLKVKFQNNRNTPGFLGKYGG